LKSVSVNLRRWQLTDASLLCELANNENIAHNMRDAFPSPYTQEDALAFIHKTQTDPHFKHVRAIYYENRPVGSIGIYSEGDIYRFNYEIGYWLGETYWGQGIMHAAVQQMVAYAFSETDAHRLFAGVFEYNIGSASVLEKNGFRLVGVAQQKVFKEGAFLNECLYELIKVV
jgi:ribosomal-protein-alanine N-acetyltransferase